MMKVRMSKIRGVCLALPVAFLLAALALWRWDASRLKVEYFANFTKRWGAPEGIGRLTAAQASHRLVKFAKYSTLRR